jgi:hypothetical protein
MLLNDVRYALRAMLRAPLFSGEVILTVALVHRRCRGSRHGRISGLRNSRTPRVACRPDGSPAL